MRRKAIVTVMMLCVLVSIFTACTNKNDNTGQKNLPKEESHEVDLKGMYTVKDPENVTYDTREALYKPYLKSDENYAAGARYTFVVIYGKDSKGQYMYTVEIFDTEENAKAYQKKSGKGVVDGKAVVITSDAKVFEKMEAFVPKVDNWINNLKESGMMPVKE